MPSFDTVLEPDHVKIRNGVDNSIKEIGTRFDFKGTGAKVELKEKEIHATGDSEFQLEQIEAVLYHHPAIKEAAVIGEPHPDWGEAVVGGIGNTNFDLWAAGHRPQNFYMLGSMGLAVPIALAAKTVYDTATALKLAREEWAENRKLCSWCQVATLISAATFALSLPEAGTRMVSP